MTKISQADLLKAVEEMSVLELSEFVKALEEKFGVSTQAMVAAPSTSSGQGASDTASDAVEPEQTVFNVVIASGGANKIAVIKAVRELVPTLGLADAKALVDSAPKEVLTAVNKKTAEEAREKLTAAGATVELK